MMPEGATAVAAVLAAVVGFSITLVAGAFVADAYYAWRRRRRVRLEREVPFFE